MKLDASMLVGTSISSMYMYISFPFLLVPIIIIHFFFLVKMFKFVRLLKSIYMKLKKEISSILESHAEKSSRTL